MAVLSSYTISIQSILICERRHFQVILIGQREVIDLFQEQTLWHNSAMTKQQKNKKTKKEEEEKLVPDTKFGWTSKLLRSNSRNNFRDAARHCLSRNTDIWGRKSRYEMCIRKRERERGRRE